MEPTSEQELRQLLDEGKIDQAEYEQLREAMESKKRSYTQEKRTGLSRKKTKVLAVLSTVSLACFLWACFLLVDSQTLRNKSLVIGVMVLSVIFTGINAVRYWIAYCTYKENHS